MTKLKEIRKKHGWSQGELARRTGLAPSNLSHLEAGKIHPWPVWKQKVAAAFGIPEDEIFPVDLCPTCGAQIIKEDN